MIERLNYTNFDTLDDYYRYMAYQCRKIAVRSKNRPISWYAVSYGYRKSIMR